MNDDLKKSFAELKDLVANGPAAIGNDVLTLRDGFLDFAAGCRQRGETEKAETWEESAKFLTALGLELILDLETEGQ
jgi:hypothetical protein